MAKYTLTFEVVETRVFTLEVDTESALAALDKGRELNDSYNKSALPETKFSLIRITQNEGE